MNELLRSGDIKRPRHNRYRYRRSGNEMASVMRRTSIRTSSIVLMPRSGAPSEIAAIAGE
jgi:hypothetical protein